MYTYEYSEALIGSQSGWQPDVRLLQGSDATIPNKLTGEAESLRAALLSSGLQHDSGSLYGANEMTTLVNGQGQWLLAVNILPSFRGG